MPALLIPLEYLLVVLVGLGMALLSRPHSGGFLNGLVRIVRWVPVFGGLTAEQIVKLDRWVTNEIGKATGALTAQASKWFGAMAHYQDVVGYWSLYWPLGLEHAVRHLVERVIPHSINARTKPLSRRIDATEAQVKATTGYAHSFPKRIHAVDTRPKVNVIERVAMPHAKEWEWVHDHFDALKKALAGTAAAVAGHALPHAPAWTPPWAKIWKDIKSVRKDLLYWTTATGAAVLVARAIGGVSARCVKRGNIGKFARRLCGLDSLIADALLADLAFVAGTISIVDFAKALQKAAPVTAGSMALLVDELSYTEKELEAYAKRALKVLESVA